MYRILCYGDSNTWGLNPVTGLRFSENERWAGVLRDSLGEGFEIIEDGMNGRDVLGVNGDFRAAVERNSPLDVIIIFLGINDIFMDREIQTGLIIEGVKDIIKTARDRELKAGLYTPEIILISAVPVSSTREDSGFFEIEAEKVRRYSDELQRLSGLEGCGFIDSGKIISASEYDGIHFDAGEHRKLGMFVSDYIRTFLGNGSLQLFG